jgi:hypothetical protein
MLNPISADSLENDYDILSRTMPFHVRLDPDRLYIHVKDYFSLRELVTENISRSGSMFFSAHLIHLGPDIKIFITYVALSTLFYNYLYNRQRTALPLKVIVR